MKMGNGEINSQQNGLLVQDILRELKQDKEIIITLEA